VRILLDTKLTNTAGLVRAMQDAGHTVRMLGVVHDDFNEFKPDVFILSESRSQERAIQKCLVKFDLGKGGILAPDKFFNQYVEYVHDPEAIGNKTSLQCMKEFGCDIVYVGEYDELIETALTKVVEQGLYVKIFSPARWKIPYNLGEIDDRTTKISINYASATISREDGWQRFLGHAMETKVVNLDIKEYAVPVPLLFRNYVSSIEKHVSGLQEAIPS
jgi:hypothetical protein